MPSYTQYMRQMAVMDASDDDIESWITVKGNHIPIKKGQSKEDAVKSFIAKKKSELVGNHNSLIEAMKLEEQGYFGKKTPSHRAAITKSANEMGKEEKNLEYLMEFGVKEANNAQKELKNKQVFYKNTSGKQIGSPKGRTFIENEIMTEKEMAKYGFDPSDKRFERKELGKNEHHFFFGARFENIKEPSEAKTIAEFETVRKNALANPNLYGGKYTQKSKYDAYKEYKNDTSSKENMQKANEFVNSELVSKKENGRYERPTHISEPLKDVVAETKAKMAKKDEPHYFHKWTIESEKPHNLTNEQIQEKLNFYRFVRSNGQSDDNELLDKIHDLSDELERRKK